MEAAPLRIAVVGTGAIGSFYGGKLAVGGRDVHFLVRGGFDQIKHSGIRVLGKKENFHERGLHVITELVINHTSDQNPWFQKSRRAPPGSPERELYV